MIEHFFTAPFWYPFLKISELIELLPAVFLDVAVLQNIFKNRVYTKYYRWTFPIILYEKRRK